MHQIRGRVLIEGEATGPILHLAEPISFWGGVEPETGRISDPRHPNYEAEISGRVLAIPFTIGSSSSSAIMLELLRNGTAPAAILLGANDAILTLGVVVARELGYPTIPVVELNEEDLDALPQNGEIRINRDGSIGFS